MRTHRIAGLLVVVGLGVVGSGFDGSRPNLAERIQRLEDQLGEALDRAEQAEAEAESLAVELDEVLETLAVEQEHREQAEKALADCREGKGS
ncbi:hypothetical protein [Tautonia rosea]|uniref:hypothetical protein n=1 Tax=Tautonia rosea TaxID=2728037 RepID=UPI00147606CF|nr:hypothetical protein [Tautonia rosea]